MKIKLISKVFALIACLSLAIATPANAGMVMPNSGVTIPAPRPGSSTVDIIPTSITPKPDGHSSFRIVCRRSHYNYDDAIAKFNKPNATHLHTFFGNTGSKYNTTYESLMNSGDSTCSGGVANKSSYWIPAMVDKDHKVIEPAEFLVYYKNYDPANVQPLPNGIKLIVGDSTATQPQGSIVKFYCSTGGGSATSEIPNCAPNTKLTVKLIFPFCWDGVNLDSVDHKSHVSYTQGNVCPSEFPVRLPNITFATTWNTGNAGTKGWHLSSDNYDTNTIPGGRSMHGDWFEAWDPEVKATWFNNCAKQFVDCGVGNLNNGTALKRPT